MWEQFTDLTNLFEKHLVQRYGIEGTKELLQKSRTDENARQKVISAASAFISDYVRRHSSTLAANLNRAGYKAPEKTTIEKPAGGITK